MTLVTIDLTNSSTTAASLARLDADARETLLLAVRHAVSGDNEAAILDNIRENIAMKFPWVDPTGARRQSPTGVLQPMPIGIVFSTMDYDNGHFLTENATVLFEDGHIEDHHFDGIDDLLTDEFGARGSNFTLAVDLRSGVLDGDDYADDSIHRRFGMLAPPSGWTVSMLIRDIRATLAIARPNRQAVSVVFATWESHGRLDHRDAAITYADDSTDTLSFGTASTYLMDAYGSGTLDRRLAVDLITDSAITLHGAISQFPAQLVHELVRMVRDALARAEGDRYAIGALFSPDVEGHLSGKGARAVHADGTTRRCSFPLAVDALLEDYGLGDSGRVLLVDLRTNAVVESDGPVDLGQHFGFGTC